MNTFIDKNLKANPRILEEMAKAPCIFVVGFMGAKTMEAAEEIGRQLSYRAISLDKYIEEKDGRTIRKLCMIMGEHEYRNQEFEGLSTLSKEGSLVVACSDGSVLDEMSREILEKSYTVFIDKDPEELWQIAKEDTSIHYAFMQREDMEEKAEKFKELYQTRRDLYLQVASVTFS